MISSLIHYLKLVDAQRKCAGLFYEGLFYDYDFSKKILDLNKQTQWIEKIIIYQLFSYPFFSLLIFYSEVSCLIILIIVVVMKMTL